MSKSLAVIGGDLQIGRGKAYQIVDGQPKLLQDLTLWILERIGTDPATPTFGSYLDGGIVDGRPVESLIGQPLVQEALSEARSQVGDLINRYRIFQLEKIQQEITRYGETTIRPEETISSIGRIDAIATGDGIAVKVVLKSLANQNLKLIIPIT